MTNQLFSRSTVHLTLFEKEKIEKIIKGKNKKVKTKMVESWQANIWIQILYVSLGLTHKHAIENYISYTKCLNL